MDYLINLTALTMKTMTKMLVLILLTTITAFGQGNQMQDNINLIKKNLSDSQTSIKKYSWIETVTVFVDGDQKSVSQNQCYYDVTGTLTKVPTGATTDAKSPGGLRGKIASNKKDDMEDYVQKAMAQIKAYIPPKPDVLQKIYAAGGVGIKVLAPNKQYELDFPGYMKTGDLLAIQLDVAKKVMMQYNINTYMDDPSDAVSLDVKFQNLPDGTSYSGNITFNAPSQKLKIVTVNSGYRLGSGQ